MPESSRAIDGDIVSGPMGYISSLAIAIKTTLPLWNVEFLFPIVIENVMVYNRCHHSASYVSDCT